MDRFNQWLADQYGTGYTNAAMPPQAPPPPMMVPGENPPLGEAGMPTGMPYMPPQMAPPPDPAMAAPAPSPLLPEQTMSTAPSFAPAARPPLPGAIATPRTPGFYDSFAQRWNGPQQAPAPMNMMARGMPAGMPGAAPPPGRPPVGFGMGRSPYDQAMQQRGMRQATPNEHAYAQRYPAAFQLAMRLRMARQKQGF